MADVRKSLLLRQGITFNATRMGRKDWHVTVGEIRVGFRMGEGLTDWAAVEWFVQAAADELYGKQAA